MIYDMLRYGMVCYGFLFTAIAFHPVAVVGRLVEK